MIHLPFPPLPPPLPSPASYAMTYHTILKDSSDYIDALKEARILCDNLTDTLNTTVYPYSVFYVYYEQYLTIIQDMALNIGLSLGELELILSSQGVKVVCEHRGLTLNIGLSLGELELIEFTRG